MRKYFWIASGICMMMLSSCRNRCDCLRINLNSGPVNERHLRAEHYHVDSIYNPMNMYVVGEQLVVVNNSRSCRLLFRYDAETMECLESFGNFGKAGGEFLDVDRSPKTNNDSTLFLYVNSAECAEFRISRDGIREISRTAFTGDVINNAIILNDSLSVGLSLSESHQFKVYDYRSRKYVASFGDFPKSPVRYRYDDDRDNVCSAEAVYSSGHNRMMACYSHIPLIRIYDMNKFHAVKDIWVSDAKRQSSSPDDFYDNNCIIYFYRPAATRHYVYVTLIDDKECIMQSGQTLLQFDWDGKLHGKYRLDCFCPVYTVSETGIFYGICYKSGDMFVSKCDLHAELRN